jgi:hypothetical protein
MTLKMRWLEPDSSGLPEGLLDQRFERWVSAGVNNSALQRAYRRALASWLTPPTNKPAEAGYTNSFCDFTQP